MDLPAARAVRGETGVVEGEDYRKVKVLAALAKVPESPWFLVAKTDYAATFAPWRRTGWILAGMSAALVLCLGMALWLMQGEQRTQILRRELQAQQEKEGLNERIAALMRQANDIILLTDRQWNILEANERAIEAYGQPLARLRQMSLPDLLPAKARGDFERQLAKMRPDTGLALELTQQRKDGSALRASANFQLISFGGVRYCQAIIQPRNSGA
jgi:PAS domain S-box-containing protein